MNNFWPADIEQDLPLPPITILRTAATELGLLTKGALDAEVRTFSSSRENGISQRLDLLVPSLGYRYSLLDVQHSPALYPANIFVLPQNPDSPFRTSESASEFETDLKDALLLDDVQRVVKALIAQTR